LLLWTNTQKLKEKFLQIINQIRKNAFEDKYYYLNIAQEYAHLKARMLREAFIQNIGDKRNHGAYISPFLFHSESELEKIDTTEISEFKWRFLLVDDKIDGRVESGILSCSDSETKLTKATILKERINQMNIGSCDFILARDTNFELPDAQNSQIQIVCVERNNEALRLMQKYEFDIILLDYLLQDNYGYQLLTNVRDLYKKGQYTYGGDREKVEENNIIIGPQKKLFFMFISAFTTAVNERLTLEVLARDEDYWLIGEGACPTNTPELFKYRLLHLMERRLDQTGISDLTEKKILNTVKQVFPVKTGSSEDWIKSVRERAYNNYHKVLGYHYDYSILRENDRGKSVLVDSFLKKQVHLGAMLEHLLQMIHLIAFGTVRQWPDIWEEYKFFTRTINSERDILPEISKSIEEYIIALKSA
jgi:CheY-like chemotaxis protein